MGRFILELPAGVLDDENGDFVGTAVREERKLFCSYLGRDFEFQNKIKKEENLSRRAEIIETLSSL